MSSDKYTLDIRSRIARAQDYRDLPRPEPQPGLRSLYARLDRALAEAVQVSRELAAAHAPDTCGHRWHGAEADAMHRFARDWRARNAEDHPEWSTPAEPVA